MADKELARVRSQFVDKVNKELISQLLDDLLEDGVLNDGQKDSILEENNSKADKARNLIDTVRKKGEEASRKMIERLQSRDNPLYSTLGLSCYQPTPPAAQPKMEQEWSTMLKPTIVEFWSGKQNDEDVYPGTKKSIGNRVALLITNIKFTDVTLDRHGAEEDEKNMENLLTALGYMVVKHTNLTGKAIDDALIAFSKHPKLKETDSVVVVIMSHGKLGAVLGVDYKRETSGDERQDEFPINNIYKHLGTENCPALLDKPKIIIIQACRGEEGGSVPLHDGANPAVLSDDVRQPGPFMSAAEDKIEADALRTAHREKDFISLLSSTPDTVSYRHRELGSPLIRCIVEVFNTFARTDHIEKLFTKVMRRFEESDPRIRQMPTKERCTLTKEFYFYPGL